MSPKYFFLVLTIVAIILVTMLAGCVEDTVESTPSTQNPAAEGDSTLTPSAQSNKDGTKSDRESLVATRCVVVSAVVGRWP